MITRNTLPRFARSVEGRDAYAKGWEARAERYLVESKVFGLSNEQRQQMVANAQAARFQAQRWRGIGRFVKGLKQRKAA